MPASSTLRSNMPSALLLLLFLPLSALASPTPACTLFAQTSTVGLPYGQFQCYSTSATCFGTIQSAATGTGCSSSNSVANNNDIGSGNKINARRRDLQGDVGSVGNDDENGGYLDGVGSGTDGQGNGNVSNVGSGNNVEVGQGNGQGNQVASSGATVADGLVGTWECNDLDGLNRFLTVLKEGGFSCT